MAPVPDDHSKQIREAAEGYAANRWLNWMTPFALIGAVAIWTGAALTLALLGNDIVIRLNLSENATTAGGVMLALLVIAGYAVILVLILSRGEQRWHGDPQVVIAERPLPPRYRWVGWAYGVLGFGTLLSLWLLLRPSPRFVPLLLAALVSLPVAYAAVAARLSGTTPPWRRTPVWVSLIVVYDLYALAVAAGLPPLDKEGRGTTANAVLLAGLFVLNLLLSDLYSRLQFRRLQRLVNESAPPQKGE